MNADIEFAVIHDQITRRRDKFMLRLMGMVEVNKDSVPDENGQHCIIWKGAKMRKGYGRINFWWNGEHVQILAHRLFLTLKLKHPIPEGYQAGHYHCHDERCVRHLQLEETKDNARDANQRRGKTKAGRG